MSLLNAFKQYVRDALPGGALNPEVTPQGLLDAAALGTAPVPVVGDVTGLLADANRFRTKPEERTPANFALAGLGALPFVPSLAGIFVGKGSKTWNAVNAAKAQEMAAKGVDPRTIWKETGTFKGADGKWRQEIDDSVAKLRDYQFTPREALKESYFNLDGAPDKLARIEAMKPYAGMTKNQLLKEFQRTGGEIVEAAKSGNQDRARELIDARSGLDDLFGQMRDRRYGPMSSYLKHGDLGKAYPDVYALHTRISPDDVGGAMAYYQRAKPGVGEQVVLGKRPMWSEDKSTMLHELQHAIQQREGFARGGSPDDAALMPYVRKFYADNIDKFDGESHELVNMAKQRAYQNLAGEAEARATQARMNMNMAQRREVFPFDSYDVPVDQLIVRGGLLDGPAMAIDPKSKVRLTNDLTAGAGSGSYRLGDVTPGQQRTLATLFGRPVSPDVMMTDKAFDHLRHKRIGLDGISPDDLAKYAEQAMAKNSNVMVDPSKAYQHPALINHGLISGRYNYDATMPLGVSADGSLFVRTIYPDGLPKKKPR